MGATLIYARAPIVRDCLDPAEDRLGTCGIPRQEAAGDGPDPRRWCNSKLRHYRLLTRLYKYLKPWF